MRSLSELETQLEETYGVTLNEAMILCSVGSEIVSAGDITSCTGMTPSHTSKTIRSVENKGLLSPERNAVGFPVSEYSLATIDSVSLFTAKSCFGLSRYFCFLDKCRFTIQQTNHGLVRRIRFWHPNTRKTQQ